jgi:hypothetical protein
MLSVVDWTADVGEDSSFRNGGVGQKLVAFFIVSDGEENVSWDDSRLLVVLGSITCKFQYFSSQIFQDSSEINWAPAPTLSV